MEHPSQGQPVLYTVRTREGLEVGPLTLEQLAGLAQEGQISSTSMVFKSDTRKWHLAASLAEVRAILRTHNPRHDSHISRLRRAIAAEGRDSRTFSFKISTPSTVYAKAKKEGLLYRLFPFLKKK